MRVALGNRSEPNLDLNECKDRKDNDAGRFVKVVSGYIGKGLRYAKLIGQDGDGLPPETSGTWQAASEMNRVHATLFADDKVLSTGKVLLSDGMFWPDNPATLDTIPNQPISLRVAGKDQTIRITDLKKCEKPLLTVHWHFETEA